MPDTPSRLAERLLAEGQKTLEFFRALTPEEWQQTVYPSEDTSESETWNLHDLLAHFVSAEASFGLLMRNILSGGEGAPQDFDIDRFNRSKVARLRETGPGALLDEFATLRQGNANLVAGLQPEDLDRKGRHPFLGIAPLADIIKLIYRHNGIHLRDVRKIAI
jgi:hypothetical protein